VQLRVVSLPDFLVMKAYAIGGRDKPKDTYDLCYCLENFSGGIETLADDWKRRLGEKDVEKAVEILREKFAEVDALGPQQLVEFHGSPDAESQAMQSRCAYELVQRFLHSIEQI
jgi:predicted nucleotidyltransferase component of viral defense system